MFEIRCRLARTFLAPALSAALLAASQAAAAGEDAPRQIIGPVAVDIVKVRDGDTVEVDAHIWPQQTVRVAVRLRGVDAPEMRGGCESERRAALAARDRLSVLLAGGSVTVSEVEGDKYFGRVLAVLSAKGEPDVAATLLGEGLVVAYGGKARRDWCTEPQGLTGLVKRLGG